MTTEWPRSVQNAAYYSIQSDTAGTNYYQDSKDERIPLLRNNATYCTRNVRIICLTTFLLAGLVTGTYLLITETTEWSVSERHYSLITREGWNAKNASTNVTIPKLESPLERILLTETNTPGCVTEDECSRKVFHIQNDHIRRLEEPDIVYNFLIAGDGQTYEGRGWKYQSFVSKCNRTLVVALLGTFNDTLPSKKQLEQARHFLQVAENKGRLNQCYTIEGVNNTKEDTSRSKGSFNYVISHLKKYFNKKQGHC